MSRSPNRRVAVLFLGMCALIIVGLLSAGCASTQPQERLVIQMAEIPQSMLHCVPPVSRSRGYVKWSDRQAAILLARNTTSAQDCFAKVEQIRKLYGVQGQRVKNIKPAKGKRRR